MLLHMPSALALCFTFGSLILAQSAQKQLSYQGCPLHGPAYPAPRNLSANHAFNDALRNLTLALDQVLKNGSSWYSGSAQYNASTFSIGLFNAHEPGLLYQYHYTAPSVSNSSEGVRKVDADSIYRLASISKLMTMYLWLINDGYKHYHTPVTYFVPELRPRQTNITSPNGKLIDWEDITLGDLASHTSGLARDYGIGDSSLPGHENNALPPVPEKDMPLCSYIAQNGSFLACSEAAFLEGIQDEVAVFPTGHTPVYSNMAFQLLGIAIERLTGTPMEVLFQMSLVEPLKLDGASYTVPSSIGNAVLPESAAFSRWYDELGASNPAGGNFASLLDMAKIGTAILNSTLLPSAVTRRWLKPRTFTESRQSAVGDAWEIVRTGEEFVYELYTKNGAYGAYQTDMILAPAFDFGFSVLTAGVPFVLQDLVNIVAGTVLPQIEQIAKSEANSTFGGVYKFGNNSWINITTDEHPGLRIFEWHNNGTALVEAEDPHREEDETYTDFRIFPDLLYAGNQVGFTGLGRFLPVQIFSGLYDLGCGAWGGAGGSAHGKVSLGELVFDLDPATGRAMSVEAKALRIVLRRG